MIFKKKNNNIKFKRIFDEMVEFGLLEDSLKTRLKFFFQNNDDFRADMINLLSEKSDKPSEIVENYYLENISKAFDEFIKKVNKWLGLRR